MADPLFDKPKAPISIIPYEFGLGAQIPETAYGPSALHERGLITRLQNSGIAADWDKPPVRPGAHTDIPELGTQARRDLVLDAVTQHHDRVLSVLNNGYYPVALGGDHTIGMGTISALANAGQTHGALGVLWIDAHLDSHTHDTSPSKAIHGMSLAHLMGYGDDGFIRLGDQQPVIRPEHLVIVAAHSWEKEEHDRLKSLGVRIYFIDEVEERGIEAVLQEACERINSGTRARALSLDIDVLNPDEAAGFGSYEPGGLSTATLYAGLRWLAAHQDFDAMELVEYNPERDNSEGSTAQVFENALEILLANRDEQAPRN